MLYTLVREILSQCSRTFFSVGAGAAEFIMVVDVEVGGEVNRKEDGYEEAYFTTMIDDSIYNCTIKCYNYLISGGHLIAFWLYKYLY